MSKRVEHGWFWLRRTGNGNLLGEYSNEHLDGLVLPECCQWVHGADIFENPDAVNPMYFKSSWMENQAEPMGATLKITRTKKTFVLLWENLKGGGVMFSGTGGLSEGVLVGRYKSGL